MWSEGIVDGNGHTVRLTKLHVWVDPRFEWQMTALVVHHPLTVHPLAQPKSHVIEAIQPKSYSMENKSVEHYCRYILFTTHDLVQKIC